MLIIPGPGEPVLPLRLKEYVGEFQDWAAMRTKAEEQTDLVNGPRYHFTKAQTLAAILESRSLHFTDYRYQNDPTEIRHGIDLISKAAMRVSLQHPDPRTRLFLSSLSNLVSNNDIGAVISCFVACFCADKRDVSLWTRYADDARGVAVAFKASFFRPTAEQQPPHRGPYHSTVRYSTNATDRFYEPIAMAAKLFLAAAESHPNLLENRSIGFALINALCRSLLAQPLIWNCVTTKDTAFASERETRLALLGLPSHFRGHVEYFERNGHEVPYVSYPIDPASDLQEVVLGPLLSNADESMVRAEMVSRQLGHIPIVRSDVPYRRS